MKILLVSPIPPPSGGIATWTKLYLNSKFSSENEIVLINTAFIGKSKNDFQKFHFFSELLRFIIVILKSCVVLYKKFDLVHINTPCHFIGMYRDYIICLFSKITKTKVLVHIRCDAKYMVEKKNAQFIFNSLVKIADSVIVINESSYNYIDEKMRYKCEYIPNFVDLSEIKNYRKIDTSEKVKDVIYVGHVSEEKGIYDIQFLAKKYPSINFKVVGFNSLSKLDWPQNMQFYGEVPKENVFKLLSTSDVFLFPSKTEGFPNALVEAMSIGLPIVATNVGATPLILQKQNQYLYDCDKRESLVNRFEEIMPYDIRRKISQINIEESENYEINIVMSKIQKHYENMLKGE